MALIKKVRGYTPVIGKNCFLADNCTIIGDVIMGDDCSLVSIGHNVTVHGAKIHDFALIGMGAVVMDDAVVGEGALVAAGSVVLSRTQIGPNELWGGAPAKFIKMVDPEQSKEINRKIAKNYLMYSTWYDAEADNEAGVEAERTE